MSAHPSNTLAALCVAGGAFGYKKTGSLPSLIGGVTLGAVFALASSRIKAGEDFGYELAAAGSLMMIGAGARRFRKATPPKVLVGLGTLGSAYYGKTLYDFSELSRR